jgi:tRNA threonylcarbamoyladenosine biosynthesis protein TsaB
MLLLAVDTSGKFGSIALAQCEAQSPCKTVEVVALEGGMFSAQLIPQISALLAKHGFTKSDLGGFAVVSGPGSFTGLRIGLSAIKALAEVLHKPVAVVSFLEAVALGGKTKGRIFAALDAGRGEIYAGEYEISGEATLPALISEQLLARDEFLRIATVVATPDKAIAELTRDANKQVIEMERPRANAIAEIGWQKIQNQVLTLPEELDANYIRRMDAEMLAKLSK